MQYIGRTDEPITEAGIALARKEGFDPNVRTVYVTPLRRTQQTAAILFPNAKQIVADDLREMDFGDFEGRSFSDMEQDAAYRAWVDGGCLEPCPNGEGREAFSKRVCTAFQKIVADGLRLGDEQLFFVVHGGTIMTIMDCFAQPKQDYYSWSVKNCQGYCCQISKESLVLTVLNSWGINHENAV